MEARRGVFYQRSLTGTDGGATSTVAPAPEPGPSLGPGGSFSGRACSPPTAAAARVRDGPRLGGRGDERGRDLPMSLKSMPLVFLFALFAALRPFAPCAVFGRVRRPSVALPSRLAGVGGGPLGVTGRCRAGVGCGHACLLSGKGRDGASLFCARFACGRGRVSAPARFARLIARARRRAHLARPFPPGAFSAPSRSLSAETPKGGPGSRLSLLSFYTIPPNVKPVREQKMKLPEIFHGMPATGTGAEPFRTARHSGPGRRSGACAAKPPKTDA